MSVSKRSKVDHIEQSDNWVPETSKSQKNRTASHNQVARRTTWQHPEKNFRRVTRSAKNTQDHQSSANSKKRKSLDEAENKPVLSTSKTESNDANMVQNKLKAYPRSKKNKSSICMEGNMKCTLSESGLESTKNLCDVNLDKKMSKGTRETTQVSKVKEKSVSVSTEGINARSYSRVGSKYKISAQSQLIAKRKEFETAAKKALKSLEAGNPKNFLMEIEKEETVAGVHCSERKYTSHKSSSSESRVVPAMTRVRERVKRHLRECTEKYEILKHENSVSYESSKFLDEEMDWEPSEQEVMIEHIKKMRRDCGNDEELSNDIALCSNAVMETTQDDSDLFLVFDTNVFISCLSFIKEIRDTCIPVLGLPRIFIPWRVLQELDHLKTSDIKPLQVSAIRAIRFLNENFSSRHPRVSGQSFEDHNSTKESVRSYPDDEILHVCLHLKQKDRSKIVILVTNDKNLESKAIVSGIESFSKDRFVREKLGNLNRKSSSITAGTDSKRNNTSLKSDMAYCRLKGALKKFLEMLLETEFMVAFNKDWKKIVTKKPPWMLMDMFDFLIKYWRSVFNFVFKRDVLVLVEDLKDHFVKVDKGEITAVKDIAQASKELLTRMMVFVTDEKPYSKMLTETLAEIEMWVELKNPSNVSAENQTTLPSPVPSSSREPAMMCNPQFDVALCKEKVKNLFQIIWEQVKAFLVSELAALNGMNNPEAVNEVKIQFPHVIRNVQELIEIVEKLLSLGPQDASQADQLILHFTSFLIGLNIFQIDATEINNLPSYIRLFCGDNDGRIVLCTLVNDLKQFAMGMMDGMKVLERL